MAGQALGNGLGTDLDGKMYQVHEEKQSVFHQIVQLTAGGAPGALCAGLPDSNPASDAPRDEPPARAAALVAQAIAIQQSSRYVAALRELLGLSKELDRHRREVERAGVNAANCAQALATLAKIGPQKRQLADSGATPALLRDLECATEARIDAGVRGLRRLLESSLQQLLQEAGWPPAISAVVKGDKQGAESGAGGFAGFEELHEQQLTQLQQLVGSLSQMQYLCEAAERDGVAASEVTPEQVVGETRALPLWVAGVLCVSLEASLREKFTQGGPLDEPRAPEWLLATAEKLAATLAPQTAALQPLLHEPMRTEYHMPFAMAEAMQRAAARILQDHVVPAVEATADSQLWLHLADEVQAFDSSMLQLLGQELGDGGGDDWRLLAGITVGRSLAMHTLCAEAPWRRAWLLAESRGARDDAEAAVCMPQPAAPLASPQPHRLHVPSRSAERIRGVLQRALLRSAWLPPSQRLGFVAAVASAALGEYAAALQRWAAREAVVKKELLHPEWRSDIIASCISSAHFLHHHLQQTAAQLQPADVAAARPPPLEAPRPAASAAEAAAAAASGLRTPAAAAEALVATIHSAGTRTGRLVSGGLRAGASKASAALSSIGGHLRQSVRAGAAAEQPAASVAAKAAPAAADEADADPEHQLESLAAQLSGLRQEWLAKLAQAVADGCRAAALQYWQRLAAFRGSGSAAEGEPGQPSPELQPALDLLQECLDRFSIRLDVLCFRILWRDVAGKLKALLYEEVATEAVFSWWGSRQFHQDCLALVDCFAPFAHGRRAAAHFRQLLDACRLLLLDPKTASNLKSTLPLCLSDDAAADVLQPVGVTSLGAEQAEAVLARRL